MHFKKKIHYVVSDAFPFFLPSRSAPRPLQYEIPPYSILGKLIFEDGYDSTSFSDKS